MPDSPSPAAPVTADRLAFLRGRGDMAERMRAGRWRETPLGPPEAWPAVLKTLVSLMLSSAQPMFISWGEARTWLYNDAFIPILGNKHPDALGQAAEVLWGEAWEVLRDLFNRVFAGESVYMEDFRLQLDRRGKLEPAHFAFSYNPVRDDSGQVVALFGACIETTEQMLDRVRAAEADERLQLALSAGAGIGTWEWDIPADRVVADSRFARLYGVDPRLAQRGAPIAQFFSHVHPEDLPRLQSQVAMTVKDGGDFLSEYRLLQPDGSVRWVSAQGRGVADAAGTVVRFPGVTFDITARKLAEQELRNLYQQLERKVVEQTRERNRVWEVSPELMGILNREGYFEKSNPAWATLLGWSEEEVRSTLFLDFVHPDDLAQTQLAWAQAANDVPVLRMQNRYRAKNGSWRWFAWIAVPQGGKVYCTARDISATKLQAQQLADERVERDRLWETSPDLLIGMTQEGIIQRVNPAWTSILGFRSAELLGHFILDFVVADDLELTRQALQDAAGGPLPIIENRYRHKDGSVHWFSWVASPSNGAIYATGRHITAIKEAEASLAQTEEALRQAQKMEAVGQLTGGLAHDFNNLLAGMMGSLELMRARMAQGRMTDIERYLDVAQGAGRRAASLTQRLLAFSRRQTLDPKVTDVNRLVSGMEELMRRTMGPAIQLEVVGTVGLWPTLVDPSQLESALLNLCLNARDSMPDGGLLTIETANKWLDEHAALERDLPVGQYISVCVTDTGVGMTPEVIKRAFDPFFTTKPIGEGTGLGLSMIYGFAKQSGGQVRIYSEVGRGTTVCIYLPRNHDTPITPEEENAHISAALRGGGEVVLVIDDEPSIRMLISEVLDEAGYAVIEVADGPAGLRILQSNARIDLLITDVGLPGGINGRQVADAARALRPTLKVLFITGYAENAVISHKHLGADMHLLTKPFPIEVLGRRVREILEDH